MINKAVAAVYVLSLEGLGNLEVAALNNSLTGFGRVPPNNAGYSSAVARDLIRADGAPINKQELLAALSFEISRRVEKGEFH